MPTATTETTKMKILLVEDLGSARKIIAKLLGELKVAEVVEAPNGAIALGKLKNESIDLVISDWHMPEIDGVELVQLMRKEDTLKDIPVILISSSANKEQVVHALQNGVSDYLLKPFNFELLSRKIKGVMSKKVTPLSQEAIETKNNVASEINS